VAVSHQEDTPTKASHLVHHTYGRHYRPRVAAGSPGRRDRSDNYRWRDRVKPRSNQHRCREFLLQANDALQAHRSDAPDATVRLATADAAHTGDFLEDDPYHEWAVDLAEEVRATHIAVLRALAARLRHAGDIDAAAQYILSLLRQDRYDEEAHLSLVKMLSMRDG
jgi:two-component SAPR family response regulator